MEFTRGLIPRRKRNLKMKWYFWSLIGIPIGVVVMYLWIVSIVNVAPNFYKYISMPLWANLLVGAIAGSILFPLVIWAKNGVKRGN